MREAAAGGVAAEAETTREGRRGCGRSGSFETLYRVNPAADAELLPALQCGTGHGRLRLARRRGRVELRAAAQG